MKQITFRLRPGQGLDLGPPHLVERVLNEDNWQVEPESVVIEDIPDPISNVIQTFEIERPSDDRLSASDLFTALRRQGFDLTVAVSEVKK